MKIGRNDLCWCNSGKKYKHCHLDRDKQPEPRPWEVDAHLRAERSSGACLYVDVTQTDGVCGKPAIASHSVPLKMLKQIARNGHVYYHSPSLQDITKAGGKPLLKLIGVNKASTWPLFCSPHDSEVFAPLERANFTGTSEQCFLLAYRAVCNEYAKKRIQHDNVNFEKSLDRGKSTQHQMEIQTMLDAYAIAAKAGFLDIEQQKLEFDKALANRDFSKLNAYVVTFDAVPQILSSGTLLPECDFDGNTLQNLSALGTRLETISHSLITTDTGGAFVFAWLDSSDGASRRLAQSLDTLPDDKVADAALRFVFEFCENHYLNPEWWDGLDEDKKQAVLGRFAKAADGMQERLHATCLREDGVSLVNWKVTGRNRIG